MKKRTRTPSSKVPVLADLLQRRIYIVRGLKVMLSSDLAELYRVESRALVQAVKRNIDRFPEDFMFQLTAEENFFLKSQFVISSWGGVRRAAPYAFTEQGVAMLSSVLTSTRAIQVNIAIMRAFLQMRQVLTGHRELARRIDELEKKYRAHDACLADYQELFKKMRKVLEAPEPQPTPRKGRFGFPTATLIASARA